LKLYYIGGIRTLMSPEWPLQNNLKKCPYWQIISTVEPLITHTHQQGLAA